MENFSFPNRAACLKELQRDLHYKKVPSCEHLKIIDAAWKRGENAAYKYFSSTQQTIYDGIKNAGIVIIKEDSDRVIGSTRYFAEFFEKAKKIILYTKSIELWCEHHQLPYAVGEELIVTHEFFHYLECKELTSINDIYKVPTSPSYCIFFLEINLYLITLYHYNILSFS